MGWSTETILGQDEGYTVKYCPLPQGNLNGNWLHLTMHLDQVLIKKVHYLLIIVMVIG